MKQAVFLVYLMMCFVIFSCTHNPYNDFQDIGIGDYKADVLDKLGSPLRSRFQNSQYIWTYRIYNRDTDDLLLKDVVLENERVVDIRDTKGIDYADVERKEKLIEQSIQEERIAPTPPPEKPAKPEVDTSFLDGTSQKNKNDTFKPVN